MTRSPLQARIRRAFTRPRYEADKALDRVTEALIAANMARTAGPADTAENAYAIHACVEDALAQLIAAERLYAEAGQ